MLTGKQKRYLRSLAVNINPITQIGKDGISENLYNAINDAFNNRELIKVNVLKTCENTLNEIAIEVSTNCKCELVQSIGKTLVFYKRNKEQKIFFND